MKRILIYGPCHAQVLQELLSRILPPEDFDLSLLINFHLIASGKPFPYADLRRYDMVIYSPINNHGDYNTAALREACAAIGCESLCISWLEWHGYCPGAQKGIFKGRYQWYYPALQTLAEDFRNFDSFYDYAIENFPDDQIIDQVFETSTAKMCESEMKNEADIRISGFVTDHFRSSRLFLISDHPSLKIYEEIIAQILTKLKVYSDVKLGFEEPQWQLRTPIFPRVANRLGLEFSDKDWVDAEVIPGKHFDLRTYLRLYYYPGSVILGPLDNARIFSHAVPDGPNAAAIAGMPAALETRLLALPATQNAGDALVNYELLEALDVRLASTETLKTFAINPDEWRSTWTF